jgi:hypothetical protein
MVAKEATQLTSDIYNDGPINSINYVGDLFDMINNVSNPSNDKSKGKRRRVLTKPPLLGSSS